MCSFAKDVFCLLCFIFIFFHFFSIILQANFVYFKLPKSKKKKSICFISFKQFQSCETRQKREFDFGFFVVLRRDSKSLYKHWANTKHAGALVKISSGGFGLTSIIPVDGTSLIEEVTIMEGLWKYFFFQISTNGSFGCRE